MKTKTNLRAGATTCGCGPCSNNHNETLVAGLRTIEYEVSVNGQVAEALLKSAPAVADNQVSSQIAQPFNGNGHSNGYTNVNGHVNGNGDGANSGATAPTLESTAVAALTRAGLAAIDSVLEFDRERPFLFRGLDDLHSDPRFTIVLRSIGISPARTAP